MNDKRTAEDVPAIGQSKASLETPVVVADIDQMDRNLREYAEFAEAEGITLRSHAKAHKIPEIARWQDERTGGGVVCQTLGEAEVMAANGIEDIYLSYMVVTRRKLERLVRLSESLRYFATTVDGEANARPLQRAAESQDAEVEVVLEVNLGLDRVGVEPGDAAVSLAEYIDDQNHLRLAGIMGYEGHIGYGPDGARTAEEYTRRCNAAMDTLQRTVTRVEAAGIDVEEVMVGSTATARYSGTHPVVTEIHPGMYLFNDANLVECTPDVTKRDCAATIVTTVISKPSADRAIVDGGSKTFSLDLDQMPVPKHRDDVRYYNASEEHGWIDTSAAETPVSVGDRIEFVVPHVCTSINLHDRLIGIRDGRVETVWNVQARGKVQ